MARSRSSFELTSAIAAASTLAREEKKKTVATPGAPLGAYDGLVSFQFPEGQPAPPVPVQEAKAPEMPARLEAEVGDALKKSTPHLGAVGAATVDDIGDGKRRPPRLPDLSAVVNPVVRCEQIVEWIAEATGGMGVFIADADGLAVAGAIAQADSVIGPSGLVASSISTLLQALPGEPSPLFEVHIGEGPYFQLIGFQAANGTYVVGLWRQTALTPRQAHAIRLACRYAFGESLGTTGGTRP
ncbi:MAG: hypothetical protein IPK82_32730 [Polyangiaceae bacterium]|nr:hypothetical protein [Polyangiaceae bacterium]